MGELKKHQPSMTIEEQIKKQLQKHLEWAIHISKAGWRVSLM